MNIIKSILISINHFFDVLFFFIKDNILTGNIVINNHVKNDFICNNENIKIKKNIKYYGGDNPKKIYKTALDLLNAKSLEEILLERRRKSFIEQIIDALSGKSYDDVEISYRKLKYYTEEELFDLFDRIDLDSYSYAKIYKEYQAIKKSRHLIQSFNKRIKRLLNKYKNYIRDLKGIYTKQHSFHFKNLDDYHSSILINNAS